MEEILHQLISNLSHCLQGFIHLWWLAGFQPSPVVHFINRHEIPGCSLGSPLGQGARTCCYPPGASAANTPGTPNKPRDPKGISIAADVQHPSFIEMVYFLITERVLHIPTGARFYTCICSGVFHWLVKFIHDILIYKKSKATGIAIHDIQNNIIGEVFIMDPMDGKTCLMVV